MSKKCKVCNDNDKVKIKSKNYYREGMFGYRCKECDSYYETDWGCFTIYLFMIMVVDGLIMAITGGSFGVDILIIANVIQILAYHMFVKYKRDNNHFQKQ